MRPSFASAANVVAALGVGRLGDIRFIRPALQSADRQTRSPGCTVKGMKFTNTIITASGAGHCDGCTACRPAAGPHGVIAGELNAPKRRRRVTTAVLVPCSA